MADTPQKWSDQRLQTPTVLQMEAVECGAASLGSVLGYFGRFVPLEELRTVCGVSRDGSKASNVLKAARYYGLEAKGYKLETGDLFNYPLPMILFWNFNHFVVLEGKKGSNYYINDPASGPRKVSPEEFDKSFTGVALVFQPGPDFKKGGEKPNLFRSLGRRLAGSRAALQYVVLAALFLVIPGLMIPIFSKIFVDQILVDHLSGWLRPLLLAMVLTALARGALTWLQQYYMLRFETRLAISGSAKFLGHVLKLPVEFFTQRLAGDVTFRVELNNKLAQLLSGQLGTNVIHLLTIIFYALLMFQYSVLLTLLGMGIAAINLVALHLVSRHRVDLNKQLQQQNGKFMGMAMVGLQMIETLKASGTESDFFSQWAGYQAKVTNSQQRLSVATQLLAVVPQVLSYANNVAILAIGALLVMDGSLTLGMLVAFQSLMASFMAPINQLVDLGSQLQESHADLNRLDDVLHNKEDPMLQDEREDEVPPEGEEVKLAGYLELQQISFGYNPQGPPLIDKFDLNLKPGSRVALVGSSGSGKSTIAKLVTGLYPVWEGEVLLDGRPLKEVPRGVFTDSLAMVSQDIFLFEGSIRENLTMWDPTIPDQDMVQAAKDACIHDIIAARPGGYASEVAEGGDNFSGGQGQRLEIARGLAKNPRILIMDEATSALDTQTEKIVDDNVRRRGCTCLIIAHRLSTIRDADEIIVLDQGKVVQRGTHDKLKDQKGLYSELIQAQ